MIDVIIYTENDQEDEKTQRSRQEGLTEQQANQNEWTKPLGVSM